METIITYKTNDGTIFDNERECYDYEQQLKYNSIKDKVKFLDSNFKPITDINDLDSIYYFIIYDSTVFDFLEEWLSDNGFYNPIINSIGIWYWEDNIERFINLDDQIKELKDLREKIFAGA